MSTLLCDGFNPSGPNAHVSDALNGGGPQLSAAEARRLGDLAFGEPGHLNGGETLQVIP